MFVFGALPRSQKEDTEMDIKAMLASLFNEDGSFNVDAFIEALELVIGKILGFIAAEEGYDF